MNPAGMMTGMMMGAAVGGQAMNMMNQMGQVMNTAMSGAGQQMQGPPPVPNKNAVVFYLVVGGQQYGPCDAAEISQMVSQGLINGDTLGWRDGMSNWTPVKLIPALSRLFAPTPPPVPGCPPPIPTK